MDIKLHVGSRSDKLVISWPSAGHLYARREKSKGIRPEDAKTYSSVCDGLTALKCFSHCHLVIQWNYLIFWDYVTVTKLGVCNKKVLLSYT